ncbi:MAG: GTP 3',8-cyclase MoaA [Desulfurococcaceae archaeon]
MLIDRYGRIVNGFRISITSKCNYNCFFCHREGVDNTEFELKSSDWGFLASVGVELGILEYKLTGGEPLLRNDIVDIAREIWLSGGTVSLTTNGSLLSIYASKLVDYVDHVNVSLHSLDPRTYYDLTRGKLENVLVGLDVAKNVGLKIKINYVVTSINIHEFLNFIGFVEKHGFDLNIIELIPLGLSREDWLNLHADLNNIENFLKNVSVEVFNRELHNRVVFKLRSGIVVSLIKGYCNPIHCLHCTRLRVTPDGRFKTCLYLDKYINARKNIIERNRRGLVEDILNAVLIREPYFR